jgi:hypothetical protein
MKCPVCGKYSVEVREMKCIGVHKNKTHAFYYYPYADKYSDKFEINIVIEDKEDNKIKVRWEVIYWEYKGVSEIVVYKLYNLVYKEENKQYDPEEGLKLLKRVISMDAFL